MNLTEQQKTQNAMVIHLLTDFLWLNRRNAIPWATSKEKLFRYAAFCYLNGKMAYSVQNNIVEAVIFYYSEHLEQLEMKVAEERPIFAWEQSHPGDCLFVAEVVGNRHAVGKLWHEAIEKWPHLLNTPIFTFRHGKLHRLTQKMLERYAP